MAISNAGKVLNMYIIEINKHSSRLKNCSVKTPSASYTQPLKQNPHTRFITQSLPRVHPYEKIHPMFLRTNYVSLQSPISHISNLP